MSVGGFQSFKGFTNPVAVAVSPAVAVVASVTPATLYHPLAVGKVVNERMVLWASKDNIVCRDVYDKYYNFTVELVFVGCQ